MKTMKRLLIPFLLFGLALLPSGIAAAGLGSASQDASDVGVSVPAHGKHPHKHPHKKHHRHGHPNGDDAEAEQESEQENEQESNQVNVIDDGESLVDVEEVIPIAANIPVIPINNVLNIIQLVNTIIEIPILSHLDVLPINLCAVVPIVTGEDLEDAECEFPHDIGGDEKEQEGISQLRNMEASAGNDETTQSNEAEQEQETEAEQEQEQDQLNLDRAHLGASRAASEQSGQAPASAQDVSAAQVPQVEVPEAEVPEAEAPELQLPDPSVP